MMTSMLQEVADVASVVIQQSPTDPLQMAVFAKKVQTIIRRCMVSIGGTLGCTSLQHDIQQTFPVHCCVAVPGNMYRNGVLVELRRALAHSLVVEQAVDALLYRLFHTGTNMSTPGM